MSSIIKSLDKALDAIDRLKVFCPTGPGGGVDPTCGSGGGRGGGKPSGSHSEGKEEWYPKFKGKPSNPKGADTEQQYKDKDGNWTKERAAMHEEIINHFMKDATPVDKPISIMMGGGPASGKSVTMASGMIKLPKNMVHVDSDKIKEKLPEYRKMTAAEDERAASFAHEESSYISKELMRRATEGGYNTTLDGTGDSGIDKLRKKVGDMRAKGQPVIAHYMTLDTDLAVKLADIRAKETRRKVPHSFIRETHSQVSKVFPQAIKEGLFDEFNLYDNNIKGKSVKVASGKGSKLTIHNQKLWDDFLAKAEG